MRHSTIRRSCLLLFFLVPLHASPGQTTSGSSPNEQYRQVSRLMAQQRYGEAIAEGKALIEQSATYHNAYIALAQASSEAGQLEQTRVWLETLLARTPPQTMAYFGIALVKQFQRDYAGAAENFDKCLRAFPDDGVVAELLAINYVNQKKGGDGETYFKSLLASQPDSVAGHQGLGVVYALLDRRAEALVELDRTTGLQPQNVTAYFWKGYVLARDVRYPEAFEALQTGLGLLQANPDDLRERRLLNQLGDLYRRSGKYPEAEQILNRSVALARASDDLSSEETALAQLASLHYRQNSYPQALEYWRLALEVSKTTTSRKFKVPTHARRHLHGIGDVYYKLGDVGRAESLYLESLALSVEAKDESNQSSVLKSLGDLYIEQGKLSQAISIAEQALAIGQKLKNLPNQLGALNTLSTLYRRMGDAAKATEYVQQALKLLEGRSNPIWEGETSNNLGLLHLRFGDVPKAKSAFETTLAMDQRTMTPQVTWQAHSGLADAYFQLGELDKAREHYQKAIETIESVRARLGGEEEKAAFFQDKVDVYKKQIALLLNPRLKTASSTNAAEAFHYVERARARAFLDQLAEARVDVEQKAAPDLAKRQEVLQQRISQLTTELIKERSQEVSKQDKAKIAELEKRLGQADTELADWLRELRRRNPRYAALKYPEPIMLAAAQRLLDDKTILVSYSLAEPQSFLFALTRNDFQVKRLPAEPMLRDGVQKLLAAITDKNNPSPVEYRRQASRLSQQLLQPISSMLAGKTGLVIIADGALLRLPFEVLFWPGMSAQGDLRRLPYLIRHCAVSYAPSVSVWAELLNEQRPAAPKGFIAFGDPVYKQPADGAIASALRAGRADRLTLQPLPYSREEINGIAKLFSDDDRAVFFAEDASEENVKTPERLGRYRMVHFSTHGYVNEARPRFSGLVLSQTRTDSQNRDSQSEDGLLSAYEIFNLKLQADLVVLSACETGLGKEIKGEGLIGLTRGFMYAGAPRVVASLWRIDDRASADVMTRFYSAMLKDGMRPAAALRAAQVSMLRDKRWQSPHYWAAFTIQGEWAK